VPHLVRDAVHGAVARQHARLDSGVFVLRLDDPSSDLPR
jgi:hypothetical protein